MSSTDESPLTTTLLPPYLSAPDWRIWMEARLPPLLALLGTEQGLTLVTCLLGALLAFVLVFCAGAMLGMGVW